MSAVIGVIVGVVIAFVGGLLCGRMAFFPGGPNYDVSKMVRENLNKDNIKSHLRHLTENIGWKTPGTDKEHEAANYILDFWKNLGLANVKATPYQIVVNYPDNNELNSFKIIDEFSKSSIFEAKQFEDLTLNKTLDRNDEHLKSLFLSNSNPGVAKGKVLYVNYARREDFEYLVSNLGQNIREYICLARYGKLARGVKALISEKYGCRALILYSDPIDYNAKLSEPPYPFSWQMPESSVQRGTIKTPYKGLADLLTPNYPATDVAHRIKNPDTGLPKIPVHVIRGDDARAVFKLLNSSRKAPTTWRGGMPVEYGIGGSFGVDRLRGALKVTTRNVLATTYNVFGFLEGGKEKDRYVIVGNHYDSWGPGAVDPSIGMAAMLELSRTFVHVHNATGWRPRRSILFCAWGAEEIGSVGSREFVEEFDKIISSRAVAYLNVDVATLGNYSIKLKSQPLLKDAIFEALKTVPNPDEEEMSKGRSSIYETYTSRFPDRSHGSARPSIKTMNTGSDYVHFIGYSGVPTLDIRYTYDESTGVDFYPLYHTAHDHSRSFETYVDPSYEFTKAVARLWGELTVRLSDETVIPFSTSSHVQNVDECVRNVVRRLPGELHEKWKSVLERHLEELKEEGGRFERSLAELNREDEVAVRRVNDLMITLEKAFLDRANEARPGVRNSLYAPSLSGKQICLSSINDILDGLEDDRGKRLEQELSKVVTFLRTSTALLRSPASFLTRRILQSQ